MNFQIDTTALKLQAARWAGFSDRRFYAAMATAATRIAGHVQVAQQREIRDVFDRPTPYTQRSVFVQRATAQSLVARVGIKDDFSRRSPFKWLRWSIDGGQRTAKAFELLLRRAGALPDDMVTVPGRFARLDAYGNISTGQIRQILSQLRIEPTSGVTSTLPRVMAGDNEATRKDKQRRIASAYKRAGGQYVAFPNGRGKLRAGIYQVRSTGFGRTDPKPVLIFVSGADYEAGRYDFDYVSQLAIQSTALAEANKAINEQLQRLVERQAGRA
jgi:hypothetical protein